MKSLMKLLDCVSDEELLAMAEEMQMALAAKGLTVADAINTNDVENMEDQVDDNTLNEYDATALLGYFQSTILFKKDSFDFDKFKKYMRKTWDIKIKGELEPDNDGSSVYISMGDYSFMIIASPTPFSEYDISLAAEQNYMWKKAKKTVAKHTAQVTVRFIEEEKNTVEAAMYFVKLVAGICAQKGALAVVTQEIPLDVEFYQTVAELMHNNTLPTLNLIWFGLYQNESGISAYTKGMESFGKYNMEIVNSTREANEILDDLVLFAEFIILEDIQLKDGEVLRLNQDEAREISISPSKILQNWMTVKIADSK